MTQSIAIERLRPHPKNPRVAMRHDVIDSIAENLAAGFDPAHALIVRPVGDQYEVVSGHHRLEAAKQAGLHSVPCWVREMSDTEAHMALVTCNSQGELSPLEIGLHALGLDLGKGGRGQTGGLSEYAVKVGRTPQLLTAYRNAAKVAKNSSVDLTVLQTKAQHLAAIHSLPRECWAEAVQSMVDGGWSAKETGERVRAAREGRSDKRVSALFLEQVTRTDLIRIDAISDHMRAALGEKLFVEWERFFSTDPIDRAEVEKVSSDLMAKHEATQTLATKHTGDEESYTPEEYIVAAREVMGGIDLDPATNSQAQLMVRAATAYTKDEDGLNQEWSGRVWLNPPYTKKVIDKFVQKLVSSPNVSQAILLTNNNTDTRWFHAAATAADCVCFTKGRINFYKPDGTTSSPTNGQAFFYFGPNKDFFARRFCDFGLVMFPDARRQAREAA